MLSRANLFPCFLMALQQSQHGCVGGSLGGGLSLWFPGILLQDLRAPCVTQPRLQLREDMCSEGSRAWRPSSWMNPCLLLPSWLLWKSHLVSLSLNFLTCKMGRIEPTLPGCCEEPVSQYMPSSGTQWAGSPVCAVHALFSLASPFPTLSPSAV